MEKPGRHHLNQMTKLKLTHGTAGSLTGSGEEEAPLAGTHSLNLVMRNDIAQAEGQSAKELPVIFKNIKVTRDRLGKCSKLEKTRDD